MGLIVKYSEGKSVPEGAYNARLVKLETQVHPQWGEGIKWTFEITDGENVGVNVTAMSSTKVSPKSKIFSWVQSFGVMLKPGEEFDLESLIGSAVRIRVKNKTSAKNVDGKVSEMTFSNVDALAPMESQQVIPPSTPVSATAAPSTQTSADTPAANEGFSDSPSLDEDQDFVF